MKYRIGIYDGHITIDATVNIKESERLRVAIIHCTEALKVLTDPSPIPGTITPEETFTVMEGSDNDIVLTSSALRKQRGG